MIRMIKDILEYALYALVLLVALYFVVLVLSLYYHFIGWPCNEWLSAACESLSANMKVQNVDPVEHFINFFYGILILIAFCIVNFPALLLMSLFRDYEPPKFVYIRK